jgi:hypothetical protein
VVVVIWMHGGMLSQQGRAGSVSTAWPGWPVMGDLLAYLAV